MKKNLIIYLLLTAYCILLFLVSPLFAQTLKKAVYVDGKSRTAIIFTDKDGLHIQYFTDNSMQLLGEEVFKDGQKIFDSYRENDGQKD